MPGATINRIIERPSNSGDDPAQVLVLDRAEVELVLGGGVYRGRVTGRQMKAVAQGRIIVVNVVGGGDQVRVVPVPLGDGFGLPRVEGLPRVTQHPVRLRDEDPRRRAQRPAGRSIWQDAVCEYAVARRRISHRSPMEKDHTLEAVHDVGADEGAGLREEPDGGAVAGVHAGLDDADQGCPLINVVEDHPQRCI